MESWIQANPQHEKDIRDLMNLVKGFIIGIGEKSPGTFNKVAGKYQEMTDENLQQYVNSMGLSRENFQYFMVEQGICNLGQQYVDKQYVFLPVRNEDTKNILDMKSRDKTTKTRKIGFKYIPGNPFPPPGRGRNGGRSSSFGSGTQSSIPQSGFSNPHQAAPRMPKPRPTLQKSPNYLKKGPSNYQSGGAGIFNPLTGKVEFPSAPAPPAPVPSAASRVPTSGQFVRPPRQPSQQKPRSPSVHSARPTFQEPHVRVPPLSRSQILDLRPQQGQNQPRMQPTNSFQKPNQEYRVPPLPSAQENQPSSSNRDLPARDKREVDEPDWISTDSNGVSNEASKEIKRKEELGKLKTKLHHIVSRYPQGLTIELLSTKFRSKHSSQLKSTLDIIDRKVDDPIKVLRKYAKQFEVYVADDDLVYPILYSPSKWKKTVTAQISDILAVLHEPDEIEKIKQDFENRHPVNYESFGFRSFYEFLMHFGDIALMEVVKGEIKLGKNYVSMKQSVTQAIIQLVYKTELEGKDLHICNLRRNFRREYLWDLPMDYFEREFEEDVDIKRLAYLIVNTENKKNVLRIENDCLKLKSKADLRNGLSRLKIAAPLQTRFSTWTKPTFSEKFYVCMVGEVFSIDEIWVQRACDYNDSMQLFSEMTTLYSQSKTDKIENDILPGCPIAIYDEPHWLRGEVIDVIDNGVLVRYVDFGSVEAVSHDRIRWLDDKYIASPKYAFPISLLSDVNPQYINKSIIDELNNLVAPFLENLEQKEAKYIFECRSVDVSGYQGFKGRIKVKTDDGEFDLLSNLLRLYKKNNPDEAPAETPQRAESESPRMPENIGDEFTEEEITSEESVITVSSEYPSGSTLESSEEPEQEPVEVKKQDVEEEPSTKEGDYDVNIVYPPEDMDINTGLYITEHSTHLDIGAKRNKYVNLVLMNINTDQLAISFETLNNHFIKLLTGYVRIKARVWLKKVALKATLNLDPTSIKEKFGDKITETESERFSRELASWGLKGVHPNGSVEESEGIFTFILWDDLWKAYCKAKDAKPLPPFLENKGINTLFEAFHRTSNEIFDSDV